MLPSQWVNRIFDKLALTYGRAWIAKWDGLDPDEVKADWARELAGFDAHPDSIRYALENLPADWPPTVLGFRAIARRAPPPPLPRLEAPKANPDVAREAIRRCREALGLRVKTPVQDASDAPTGQKWGGR